MLKKAIPLAAVLVNIITSGAADWRLLSSCPAPCAEPRDLTPGAGCYLVGDGLTPQIYEMDPATGSVYSSFPAPGGPGAWGITDTGDIPIVVLYFSNNRTSWIYKITTTGSVLSSYLCPLPGPAGISWGGPNRLEVTIPDLNVVAALHLKEGYLISACRGPGLRPTSCIGVDWDFVGDAGTHTVYRGSGSKWYPIITGIEAPSGMDAYQYHSDNGALWGLFIVDAATKYIYHYEDDAAVTPASLGRVKALFR
jgi:hypothetical protein